MEQRRELPDGVFGHTRGFCESGSVGSGREKLGLHIVGECGGYVTRIVDKEVSGGRTYLVIDGGLTHQLAAAGNLGQVIRRNYPSTVGNRLGNPGTDPATVGSRCTPLDLLGDNVVLAHGALRDSGGAVPGRHIRPDREPTTFLRASSTCTSAVLGPSLFGLIRNHRELPCTGKRIRQHPGGRQSRPGQDSRDPEPRRLDRRIDTVVRQHARTGFARRRRAGRVAGGRVRVRDR